MTLTITAPAAGPDDDRLPPVHPGEILLEDFLKPMGLSQYRLARALGCRCDAFTTWSTGVGR